MSSENILSVLSNEFDRSWITIIDSTFFLFPILFDFNLYIFLKMDVNIKFEGLYEKFENALMDRSKSDAQRSEDKRIQRIMSAYRTEICRIYRTSGTCSYGDACRFAHSNDQLRSRQLPHNYKTKLCRKFEEFGFCIYGAKCLYIHRDQRLPNSFVPSHFALPRLSNSSPAWAPFSGWSE